MLIISSKEFRVNQGKYLGLAAEGTNILLKSRRVCHLNDVSIPFLKFCSKTFPISRLSH